MSNQRYALIGLGGLLLGSALGSLGFGSYQHKKGFDKGFTEGHEKGQAEGYIKGYDESEPEMYVLTLNLHGQEGLCVVKNSREAVCALDENNDGAVDLVYVNWETKEPEKVLHGKHKCSEPKKALENLVE